MLRNTSLLVALVKLVDVIPVPPAPPRRGRPTVYSDRVFLKALVIMIVRHLATVGALLAILEQPTREMQQVRCLLTEQGRSPSRRTFERVTSTPQRSQTMPRKRTRLYLPQ